MWAGWQVRGASTWNVNLNLVPSADWYLDNGCFTVFDWVMGQTLLEITYVSAPGRVMLVTYQSFGIVRNFVTRRYTIY